MFSLVVSIRHEGTAKEAPQGIEMPQQAVFPGGRAKDPTS
jgi:hypothetical protein